MLYWELRLRLAATMMLRRVVSISGVANRTQTVRMKRNVIYMEDFWIFCTPVAVRIVKNADQLSAMEYSKQERDNRKNAGLSTSSCHYF